MLIASAVTAAASQPSIAAKIREQINLHGQQLVGAGAYWQQGRGDARRFRLELKVQVGEGVTGFEQVCTGAELWMHEDFADKRQALTKIDLVRIRDVLHRNPQARDASATTNLLPLGGLPKLLQNLEAAFQFSRAEERKLDQLTVWRVEGQWKPAALADLIPDMKEKLLAGHEPDWKKVPGHIPQRVVLTLGQDDLFPYRIEYVREQPVKKGAAPILRTADPRTVRGANRRRRSIRRASSTSRAVNPSTRPTPI